MPWILGTLGYLSGKLSGNHALIPSNKCFHMTASLCAWNPTFGISPIEQVFWSRIYDRFLCACACRPHDFVKLFGGLMRRHGAIIHLPPSPVVPVSMYPHSFSKYFQYVMQTETQVHAQGLRAKWNLKTRRMNTRFDWTTIPRSWDTVNKSIQWSNCRLGRLIHMWRMTDH